MIIKAFLVGGAICAVCQIFIDKTKLTPARILVSLVCIGVVLGLLGIYKPVVDFAGAGATVPLLGFGYNMFRGVTEAVASDGFLGTLTADSQPARPEYPPPSSPVLAGGRYQKAARKIKNGFSRSVIIR